MHVRQCPLASPKQALKACLGDAKKSKHWNENHRNQLMWAGRRSVRCGWIFKARFIYKGVTSLGPFPGAGSRLLLRAPDAEISFSFLRFLFGSFRGFFSVSSPVGRIRAANSQIADALAGSAVTVGLQRHHHRLSDVRGGGFGDVVGGLEGGRAATGVPQLGHHEEEVVGAGLARGDHTLHRLGGHFGGALHAGTRAGVLAAEQGQEAPVKLGKHRKSFLCWCGYLTGISINVV